MGSVNSTISTEGAATAALRNTSKTSASVLLVRAADSLTLASPVKSGDSIYAFESPVNSGDSSKTLGRTLASLVHSGDIIKTKAAKPKAGNVQASLGQTATKFLATSSLIDSGDSSRALASVVHSGGISKTKTAKPTRSDDTSLDQKAAKPKAGI